MTVSRIATLATLPLALAFAGCGEPDPDSTPDAGVTDAAAIDAVLNDPPTAHVAYPPPESITGESTITLRGTASDADGVAAIRVNGTLADTQNNFAEWQVSVPLQPGDNDLVVESEDTAGNVDSRAAALSVVQWSNYLRAPIDFVMDIANRRAIIYDSDRQELIAMDRYTSDIEVLSGPALGTGPLFQNVRAIALHPGTNTVYLADFGQDALMAIDTATGDRTVVSNAMIGTGFPLLHPIDLEIDTANNRAVVLNRFDFDGWRYGVLYTIDLSSGDRTLVGADDDCIMNTTGVYNQMGQCATLADWATSLGYDPLIERAWIFEGPDENDSIGVVSVDLLTASKIDWPFNRSNSEFIHGPVAIVPDTTNMRVLFAEQVHGAIMAMDQTTGLNFYLSSDIIGDGRTLDMPVSMHIDPDDNDDLWVLNNTSSARGIFSIYLPNGNRYFKEPGLRGGSPLRPDGMYLDTLSGLIYGTDDSQIIHIDLDDGDWNVSIDIPLPVAIPPGNYAARQWQRDMAVDASNRHMYILHQWEIFQNSANPVIFAEGAQILVFDGFNGDVAVVAENGVSAGPDFGYLESVVFDRANNRLLVTNRDIDAIMAVDLPTGERSVFADAVNGAGSALPNPVALTMIASSGLALFVENDSHTLLALDLDSGDRTELSGPTLGAGPAIDSVIDMALDFANSRVFIASDGLVGPSRILAVDLVTGDRSVVSENGIQSGPEFHGIQSLVFERSNEILYVSDWRRFAVLAVDVRDGTRVISSR